MQNPKKWQKENRLRDQQIYCGSCGKPVGFTNQSPAYSNPSKDMWLCEADNMKYWKTIYDQERYTQLHTTE